MTSEEKIARGDAPIKEEFIRRVARVRVDTVTGSLGVASSSGKNQQAAKKKSRNQLRKERNQQRFSKAELCSMLVQGNCKFGDSCRFNHDVSAYLDTKPGDLPGSCPFSPSECCPYGITCRWASKHPQADHLAQQAQHTHQNAAAQQERAAAENGRPAGQQLGAGDGRDVGGVATSSPEVQQGDGGGHPSGGAAEGDEAGEQGAALSAQGQPGSECQAEEELQQGGWWRGDGTIPTRVMGPLPPSGQVQESMNTLEKGLQSILRKEQYDFGRADAVLRTLGIHNSRQKQRQAQRQQRREDREAAEEQQGQQAQQDASPPRSAKKSRMETAAVDATSDPSPAMVAAEAAAGQQDGQAPGSDAVFLAGLGQGLAGEVGGAAAAAQPERAAVAEGDDAGAAATAVSGSPGVEGGVGGDSAEVRAHPREKRTLDFKDKLYLAPLTTVGNLPFRRLCKGLGADITCGEMALATNLLQGQASEWALLKRHPSEDCFGVQVCGGYPDSMARCAQLIEDTCQVDFVDVNFGCPIDVVCSKGGGSACLLRPHRMEQIVRSMSSILSCPLTFKSRKGYHDNHDVAHTIIPRAREWGASAVTLHGRTREQRYSRLADWDYIHRCAALVPEGLQLVGNGDCFSRQDYRRCLEGGPNGRQVAAMYIARGALIKPWIFTEIKEDRDWDISAGERLDLLRKFCSWGLEHWGSDSRGVETTRRFLLEWLSFTYRYIPLGLLEVVPQQMHWRPPAFVGRNDLETLLASDNAADWVRISELLLGPAPAGFVFAPKHKANSYAKREGADVAINMDEY